MPYRYLEDIATADVAFEAVGKDLAELFTAAADALLNVMVSDPACVARTVEVKFEVRHRELDLLLFNFLQELVFLKDARCLLLHVVSVDIESGSEGYSLTARTAGEEPDPQKHDLIVDVKAVTLYRFELRQTEDGWLATVVLDI